MTELAGFNIRAPSPGDAEAVNDLVAALDTAVQGFTDSTVEDIRDEWNDLDLGNDAWLVEDARGLVVGYASVELRGEDTLVADAYVHPQAWGRGIGAALVRLTEARAHERGVSVIRNAVLARDASARSLLERLGYRDARHFYRMAIELDAPPPEPVWPAGVEVEPFAVDSAREVYEAVEEAFADEWGHERASFDDWRRRRLERDDFDPGLWFVAREGSEIAGAVLCNAKRWDMGWVASLAVRKPWRRRGLGLALLRQAFGEFYRRGERVVGLGVDTENPTGATRLYERAGMCVTWEAVVYEKELTPAAATL